MTELFDIIMWPGLAAGLVLGGLFAYLVGVRDPFVIALIAVVAGIGGLIVEFGWSKAFRPRRKVG
jgi:uncharacterized membrane protein YjjP (DUF1212 family)